MSPMRYWLPGSVTVNETSSKLSPCKNMATQRVLGRSEEITQAKLFYINCDAPSVHWVQDCFDTQLSTIEREYFKPGPCLS
jgi:hypothetical protein